MATVNFYLDKTNKKGLSPIHLRINNKGTQIKLSTGVKIDPDRFDKECQRAIGKSKEAKEINHYIDYLKNRTNELLHHSGRNVYTKKEIKDVLTQYIKGYKENNSLSIVKEQITLYGKPFTFIDLFAGAGGFSEGFLQAEINNKHYDFVLASDINENCELTHVIRYNHQLGLDAKFIRQDITESDFLDNLLTKIGDKQFDVVCGGPPCQSFSLAGKRKKFDKKDDLFAHYLKVIKALQPKYFIMENVKGILTKEKGAIKNLIIKEINSILDNKEIPLLIKFIKKLIKTKRNTSLLDIIIKRIAIEEKGETGKEKVQEEYIRYIDSKFKQLTPKIVDYRTSKMDARISTIRHGFNMLARKKQWEKLKRAIIKEKDYCNIDNDSFADSFTTFLTNISTENIIKEIQVSFEQLEIPKKYTEEYRDIITALKIYISTFDETLALLYDFCNDEEKEELNSISDKIRLYKIEKPFVANASNYGVPQNRERVLFIGCRKDQKFISEIPPTVSEDEKVTIFEALYDLDFIGNNEEVHHYEEVDINNQYNGTAKQMKKLLKKRSIDGKGYKSGKTFSQWSKDGRLIERYKTDNKPFYVKNFEALNNGEKDFDVLNNHKTSNQNHEVVSRLKVILKKGDYKKAKPELEKKGLASKKRNYNVLKPAQQSSTIMTIPDDYIHYNSPRALTVREMARLQSFDDSFVFQGKRSTGGNNRKSEVPQYTLVGNAVPPLLARAVAMEVLKNIR